MAHYAFIDDNNIVTQVIAGRDEDDLADGVTSWEQYYGERYGQTCVQTSYNTLGGVHYTDGEPSADQGKALRFNYAGIGFSYDSDRDAFIAPKPYESWVLDEATCFWESPIPYPGDEDTLFEWDEDAGNWVEGPEV